MNAETKTFPEQAWAHKLGLVRLGPNKPAPTLAELPNQLAIIDAFSRFGIGFDEGRADVIASLFTRDAVFQVTEGSATPHAEARGADAIAAQTAKVFSVQRDQRRHAMTNVLADIDGDRASAIAYGLVVVAADGLSVGASVVYAADLVRGSDGAWRFSRFVIGMDTYSGRKPTVD